MEDAKNEANPNVSFLLIGNKSDLHDRREVSFEEGKAFASHYGIDFLETSAKSNINVREAFSKMSVTIMDKVLSGAVIVDDIVNSDFNF